MPDGPRPGEDRHSFFIRRIGELGVDQKDADYGGELARWVLDLSRVLRDQRHSGQSFALTLDLFRHLIDEWERPQAIPDQPTLSPAAKFDAAAAAIAALADQVEQPPPTPVPPLAPRSKLFLSKEDPRLSKKATCSGCHADIFWLTSAKSGKKMPFDRLDLMIDEAGDLGVDLSKNHWATCPTAPKFRHG